MSTSELVVVTAERQVELAAKDGIRAETRRRLCDRLAAAFLQNARFAGPATARAALASVLPNALEGDASVARLQRSAEAWERTIDAFDDAIDALRADGVDARALGEVEDGEPIARLLRRAMNALDARLERAGLVDERLRPWRLASAMTRVPAEEVARVIGATSLRARNVVRWDAAEAAWWRAAGSALARVSGGAVVELPVVTKPIDATRASDPFEIVLADVARVLDEAPIEIGIERVVGDATFTGEVPDVARERIEIRRALDADAQARAVVAAVGEALEAGIATDRVAIAVPHGSERARAALVRHFEEAGIALHFSAGRVEGALADVAFALLDVGTAGLPRRDVASLVRSRALDPSALTEVAEPRAARASLRDFAEALERTAAAEVDEPLERLVATATALESPARDRRGALARRIGAALLRPARPGTRAEHARRARTLFAEVGLAARAGGAIRAALARDEPRSGITRCELEAYARDARVLEALGSAVDELERVGLALGDETCAPETFVHELRRALRVRGTAGAARAGAVRAVGLEQLAGEPLELLVVVDANDGVLPARASGAGVVTPALHEALLRREERRGGAHIEAARSLVELAAAAHRARRLVLCHRVTDDDGAALAPSPLVSWLERGGVEAAAFHSAPLLGAPVTMRERELALIAVAPDRAERLAPHAARVAAREAERELLHATSDPSLGRLPRAAELRALLELETGGGARALSVTAIERMSRCAFQGFAAQLLGALDDDPRTEDAPDRREEGILAHEALGAAFTAAAPLWRARPRDRRAIEEVAAFAADAVLARSGGALVRASLDRMRLEVARIVSLAIDDVEWDFAYSERGFGNAGDEWPALVLEDARGRVTLRGRIDRVDVSAKRDVANGDVDVSAKRDVANGDVDVSAKRDVANGDVDVSANGDVCAIDYKRRVSLPAIADLGQSAIQVLLYAIVARRELSARTARGRYLSTLSPRPTSQQFDARFAALVDPAPDGSTEVTRAALERIHSLRDGEIAPVPSAPKWCAQCGLDGACRRPRFAVTMVTEDGE